MNWHPIDTAPITPFDAKDWFMPGSPTVLACIDGRVVMARYGYTKRGVGRWQDFYGRNCKPTHWMPLPEPPQS